MNRSFYNLFECDTKEELYSKIKNKDPIIQELLDFYEYKSNRKFEKSKQLTSPENLVKEFSNFDKDINKIQAVFMNNKLQTILIKEYDNVQERPKKELIKEILTDKYISSAPSFFIFANSKEFNNGLNDLDFKNLENHGLVDSMIYNYQNFGNNGYYSQKGSYFIKLDDLNKNNDLSISETQIVMEDYLYNNKDLINTEFQEYYSRNENRDLNIIKDLKNIKKNLKLGFEDLDYEIAGIMMLDKDYNIIDQQVINIGNVNTAVIDRERIFKNLLQTPEVEKWVFFHNHPSGSIEPSIEDIKSTSNLIKLSNDIEVDLVDHFIVGKEKVLSLAEETIKNIDYNIDFRDDKYMNNLEKQIYKDKGRSR